MDEIDTTRVICALHELADPGAKGFTMGQGEWPLQGFVVRTGTHVYGYVNYCPHAGSPLNWQPDQFLVPGGNTIRCVMHGALFEMETGSCLSGPCMGLGLQPLQVHVRHGYVLLDEAVPMRDPN